MKFLIAGLGSIGRRHLRNLRALGETDIILYRTHLSTLPDEELAGLPEETDLQRALDQKPDAVIVANPTSMHLDVAIPAVEAGCSILLEKPVSHNLDRLGDLAAAARRSHSRILVGFHFRFHPTLRKAAELLSAGAIGHIVSVRTHWGEYLPNWHPWEDFHQSYAARADLGGGVILTLTHPFDYLRFIVGEMESLWAFTSAQNLNLDVEDTAEIGLRFVDGAVGSLHLNYNQQPSSHTLDIIGSNGVLHWDNADGILRLRRALASEWDTFLPPEGFERNVMFMDEMRHFLSVVQGEARPICRLEDGVIALKMALAAQESARSGQLVPLK